MAERLAGRRSRHSPLQVRPGTGVQAAGIGWQPRTVHAMSAGGCAAVRCWDEWLRCRLSAANVVEIGAVSIPTVSRATIVAAPSLMPLPRARLRTLRLD